MKPEIDIDPAITLLFFLLLLSVCISLSLGGMRVGWHGNRVFIDLQFLDIFFFFKKSVGFCLKIFEKLVKHKRDENVALIDVFKNNSSELEIQLSWQSVCLACRKTRVRCSASHKLAVVAHVCTFRTPEAETKGSEA